MGKSWREHGSGDYPRKGHKGKRRGGEYVRRWERGVEILPSWENPDDESYGMFEGRGGEDDRRRDGGWR